MRTGRVYLLSVAAICATLVSSSAEAQRTGLEDMVGARAGQAEGELMRRGFRNVRGEKGDDRSYAYWWNADRRQCVTIATMDGRYSSITPTTAPDCRQSAAKSRPDRFNRPDRPSHYDSERGDQLNWPNYTKLDFTRLQRDCRMQASATFDRRPGEIFVNAPVRQPNGFIVQGGMTV